MKHQPSEPRYLCRIGGCGCGVSHRVDKLGSLIKSCHLKSNEYSGTPERGRYCIPDYREWSLFQDFLAFADFASSCDNRLESPDYLVPLDSMLIEADKGMKGLTGMDWGLLYRGN